MSLKSILERLPAVEPAFTTIEEMKAFHAREAKKDNERLNRERMEIRSKRLFAKSCVSERHRNCTFESYHVNSNEQAKALKIAQYYAENFEQQIAVGRSLIFHGTTGTGKNHLASAIANHLLPQGYSVLIIKVADLMSRFRACYQRDSDISEERLSHELAAVDLLVLDEVGVSHGSNDEQVQINRLIDNRVNKFKPIMVLTNLNLKELENNLGGRNIDRLLANQGAVIEFNWESFRRRV